ncbi:MAG: hypothetical protein V7752_04900 [Halopseudomonas sp.]
MSELLPPDSDLRRSERLDTHLNALVINSWQEQCAALVTNITREGIRLEGRRELVDIIFPNFNAARPALRHTINLRLALEEGVKVTDLNGIDIRCNSVYVVRERQDWFQLGLSYCEIDNATAVRLEAFINELEQSQVTL